MSLINYKIPINPINQNYNKIYTKNEISDFIFDKNNICSNCNIKLNRKYLKLYFEDNNMENIEDENLKVLCNECYNITIPNNENNIIIVLPRNRLDHITQSEFVYYLRFLYILKLKYYENLGKDVEFIKTTTLFEADIISDVFIESNEFFEELIDEIEEVEEEFVNFKKFIKPDIFNKFAIKYFSNDEDRIEEIEESIILLPLFENTIKDFFYITNLYNKLRNKDIKNNLITFLKENKEIFNSKFAFSLLEEI